MQLHQINQLSYPSNVEQTWQHALQFGDAILLLEEAILRTSTQHDALTALIKQKDVSLFYLHSDAAAYGLNPSLGKALNDEEWVNITLTADVNISW